MKTAKEMTPEEIQKLVDKNNKALVRDRKYWIRTDLRLKAWAKLVDAKKAVDVTDADVDAEYAKRFAK